ncbi:MAG TPA: ABC transporter permease [Usitatibacter sp.]|jgi:peptide/nickel transport system permease protein|nr:ABC transporter permease [Usitatibacter sp.]
MSEASPLPATLPPAAPEDVSPRTLLVRRMLRHKGFLIGLVLMAALGVLAALAPLIAGHNPFDQDLVHRLMPPAWSAGGNASHLFGTDHLGRDYLARLLYGARISLAIGLGAASVGCLIGVTLGVCAGFFGGRVDQAVSYLLTCQLALPGLLLAMALVFLIGPSLAVVILVIGCLHWSYYVVVTRAATLQLKRLDFIAAAEAIGETRMQVIVHELMPNLLNPILVIYTLEIGVAVLAEAALSFLGVGVQPPTPSWGLMIAEGKDSMFFRPWLVVLPGVALFLLVMAANLLGDGLRDVSAPESRN